MFSPFFFPPHGHALGQTVFKTSPCIYNVEDVLRCTGESSFSIMNVLESGEFMR